MVSRNSLKTALVAVAAAVTLALFGGSFMTEAAGHAKLVGRWHFNQVTGGITRDSSGNKNNGLVVGATMVKGKFGNALSFGPRSYVQVTNSPVLEPPTVSVEAWVNASTTGPFRYIVSKGAQGCNAASYALYTGPSGGLFFYVSNGSTFTISPDAGAGVWDGHWHHVTGTFDGARVHLYVDGAELGSGTPAVAPILYSLTDSRDLFVGTYAFPAPGTPCVSGFVGTIDEVRVWNGVLPVHELHEHAHADARGGPGSLEGDGD